MPFHWNDILISNRYSKVGRPDTRLGIVPQSLRYHVVNPNFMQNGYRLTPTPTLMPYIVRTHDR